MVRVISAICVLFLMTSCSLISTSDCPSDLSIQRSPVDITLSVGDQFTGHLSLRGCHDRVEIHDTYTWVSEDTTVLTVDRSTGVATAVKSGSTRLLVETATYGEYVVSRVTVR